MPTRRPGLIGWTVFNLGFACKQYEETGGVSVPMAMVVALEGLYVWDALYNEKVSVMYCMCIVYVASIVDALTVRMASYTHHNTHPHIYT